MQLLTQTLVTLNLHSDTAMCVLHMYFHNPSRTVVYCHACTAELLLSLKRWRIEDYLEGIPHIRPSDLTTFTKRALYRWVLPTS